MQHREKMENMREEIWRTEEEKEKFTLNPKRRDKSEEKDNQRDNV